MIQEYCVTKRHKDAELHARKHIYQCNHYFKTVI